MKVQIIWNGTGGQLDSRVVECAADDEAAIRNALLEMIGHNGIITPGDSFIVQEVA